MSAALLAMLAGLAARVPQDAPPAAHRGCPEECSTCSGAIQRAEDWLLRRRDSQTGAWTARFGGEETDVILTSVAGLALMAGGSDHRQGERREEVAAALAYVRGQAEAYRSHWCFQHPFALVFLAEAARRGGIEGIGSDLGRIVARCAAYQEPDGGWKYGDPEKLAPLSTTTATTYCVLFGLAAAREAGAEVPPEMVARAVCFLEARANADGGFRYHEKSELVTTAGVVAALSLAGACETAAFRNGAAYFAARAPEFWSQGTTDSPSGHHAQEMCLFFGTVAAARVGGALRGQWDGAVRERLLRTQAADGSWEFEDDPRRRGTEFSALFSTATALFALRAPLGSLALLQGSGAEGGRLPGR